MRLSNSIFMVLKSSLILIAILNMDNTLIIYRSKHSSYYLSSNVVCHDAILLHMFDNDDNAILAEYYVYELQASSCKVYELIDNYAISNENNYFNHSVIVNLKKKIKYIIRNVK